MIPAIMAASFVCILFLAKRLRIEAHWFGIAAVGACFLFSLAVAGSWIGYVSDASHGEEASTLGEQAASSDVLVAAAGGEEEHEDEEHEEAGAHAPSVSCLDHHEAEDEHEASAAPGALAFAEAGESHTSPCPVVNQVS